MNLNILLVWVVCFACIAYVILHFPNASRREQGWSATCGIIIAITLGLFYYSPRVAGIVGGSLWLIFFVLPVWGESLVEQLSDREQYRRAYRLAFWLRWLHPWGERLNVRLALAQSQQGLEPTALYADTSPRAQALLFALQSNWSECLRWMKRLPQQARLKDPQLVVSYLRALGETGALNELLAELAGAQPYLKKRQLRQSRLYALAFCGRTEQVRRLLSGSLSHYPERTKNFWLLTAMAAAGQDDLEAASGGDPILARAIAWRRSHSIAVPQHVLTDSSKQVLARLQIDLRRDKMKTMTNRDRQAYATYGLVSVNLLAFGLEIYAGGSEDLNTLYQLGALVPQAIWSGQWWRLLSANFLHYGWLHLLTNMLGLYFLGRPVEISLGITRYLLIYLGSGVGAMFIFALWAVNTQPAQILVGASAAIMGLIGAVGAIFLRGWQRERSRLAARRLRFIVLIVGLQFAFDLSTPQVSFLSHLLGLILGFGFGLLLT